MLQFPLLVLYAWILTCAALFAYFRPAKAITLAFLIAWLVMPMARMKLPGVPDLDKISATSVGVVLGTLLFQTQQFRGYRIGWGEVFIVGYAASCYVTSVRNDLGPYDGLASAVDKLLVYGVPYVCGRAYIRTRADLREACQTIVVASAIYAIPALWEWRMSPQIHLRLYGFGQQSFNLSQRWGFYRPIVCFPANLALGGFFCWTGLLAWAMYRNGELKPLGQFPKSWLIAAPLGGLLVSMSLGPWALFLVGFGVVYLWMRSARRTLLYIGPIFALGWMAARYTETTDGRWLTDLAAEVSVQRSESLQYRIDAETMFIEKSKAPDHQWFGWGGWGRNRIRDDQGRDIVAIDGLWLIVLSTYGLAGLILFYLWWMYPLLRAVLVQRWLDHDPVMMAILVGVALQAVNFVFNAFLDPLLTLLVGAAVYQMETRRSTGHRVATIRVNAPVASRPRLSGEGAA